MGSRAPVKDTPSAGELHRLFAYDPDTGVLTARISRAPLKAGNPAGTVRKGRCPYLAVGIAGKYYLAHRVIWKMMNGEDAPEMVDHVDGDKLNNRWSNLRAATNSQNGYNMVLRSDNTSGCKGVVWEASRRKWRVTVTANKRQIKIGRFDTIEEAVAARGAAAQRLHGEFYRAA